MSPATRLGPLLYVCGAPGTGKSVVLPALITQADGEVVIDGDELLDDGSLLGVRIATPSARPVWPAYDRMWRRITGIIRRAGHPVIMLTQVPDAADLERSSGDPDIRWLGWDCPDDVRIARLTRRGWDSARIDDALLDAAACRRLIPDLLVTDDSVSLTDVASTILERSRSAAMRQP